MGCCLSREEDRFDANEALLPKSSSTTKQSAVVAKSDASVPSSTKSVDTGSYKSPEPTLSHHTHGAAAHSCATVVTTTIATEKHTAVVESIDLLGLDKTTSPTPPSTLSATAAAFQPHSTAVAVPTAKLTPPETTTQAKPELLPPKPTSDAMSPGSPQSVEGAARPVEVTVAHVTAPEPLLTKQERSPPLPLEEKKSGTIEPKAPTSSVASTDDADNDNDNDNDNDADKASASATSGVGSGSKKGKKKKKQKGRK
jgi:hypothetical protein